MKFLYIGAFRFPNGDAAGSRVLNNARALRLAGHDVEFIAWGGSERQEDLCNDGLYRYDGFVYQVTGEIILQGCILHKLYTVLTAGHKTKKILNKRMGSYDAVIFYNGSYGLTKFLLRLGAKNNIRIIHDITEWYATKEVLPMFRYTYNKNMKELQHKVPNKICISSYLSQYYSGSNNITVPALCDASEDKWKPRSLNNLPTVVKCFHGVRFIYAGIPAKKDLLHNAINVINKLAKEGFQIQFLILGSTKDDYLSSFSDELKDKDLHKNIVFLGRVSQTDVPAYYQLADFMLLLREPTRKSQAGFPTKFAEAMISGTPVCANITSDLGMYLKDGFNGIVVPGYSENELENTLRKWLPILNKEKLSLMKLNTISSAHSNFDYHAYTESIIHFIKNLR